MAVDITGDPVLVPAVTSHMIVWRAEASLKEMMSSSSFPLKVCEQQVFIPFLWNSYDIWHKLTTNFINRCDWTFGASVERVWDTGIQRSAVRDWGLQWKLYSNSGSKHLCGSCHVPWSCCECTVLHAKEKTTDGKRQGYWAGEDRWLWVSIYTTQFSSSTPDNCTVIKHKCI